MDNFSKEARAWTLSVIRQRKRLLQTGESKVPEAVARMAIEELSRHLDAYNYNNVNMAGFLLRNREKIRAILPGAGASAHMRRRQEFSDLLARARAIQTEPLKLPTYA